ncbi:MAG: hypothetical protein GYA24_02490 [Candidatus Lokiarchaeota archaeon]|nr:hypothetical protein [Candidatus Lokiarchaeota archaeon]
MGRKKSTGSSHPYYHHWSTIKLLVIIGAIVTILLAVLWMIPMTDHAQTWVGTAGLTRIVWLVIWGILHIVIAIGLLSGTGAVRSRKVRIWCDWWVLIILGLVIVIPTGNWGGVIVVIAGVIGLIDRLD